MTRNELNEVFKEVGCEMQEENLVDMLSRSKLHLIYLIASAKSSIDLKTLANSL